jgi:arylsulfatase A-like enzyme
MNSRPQNILFHSFSFLCLLGTVFSAKPNVVFIMADDLGWADTTLYGHTALYETPNLERLAKRGMLFERAYTSSPLCSPTRSAVLTGLHPARTGLTAPTCHLAGEPILRPSLNLNTPAHHKLLTLTKVNRLDTEYPNMAKTLKQAGYHTAHFGKWHLGRSPYTALDHGFDVDVPNWYGPGPAGSYVAPWKFPDFKEAYPGEHIEDRMADEIDTYLEKRAADQKPFYLNYWQFSVHGPFNAKADYIESYKDKVNPNDAQNSPTYAAMVKSLDDNVGRVLDQLDELKLSKNTLIFFYSDNGGNMYSQVDGTTPTSNRPLRGGKGNNWDGGVRVPCIAVWPGHIEEESKSKELVTSTDFYPTILDLLGIPKKESQTFDGISIRPALEGKPMDKRYIFTYFPHATKVPDTFPNSAAIYDDEWKLIRLLHNAPNGDHEHWLFHLKKDIGERNEVSKKYPKKVAELSKELNKFLTKTGAIYPTPNPNYNPDHASTSKAKKTYSAAQFKKMDKNQDGFITLKEYIGNPEGRNVAALKKQFSRRDGNGDAKLTLPELNK